MREILRVRLILRQSTHLYVREQSEPNRRARPFYSIDWASGGSKPEEFKQWLCFQFAEGHRDRPFGCAAEWRQRCDADATFQVRYKYDLPRSFVADVCKRARNNNFEGKDKQTRGWTSKVQGRKRLTNLWSSHNQNKSSLSRREVSLNRVQRTS